MAEIDDISSDGVAPVYGPVREGEELPATGPLPWAEYGDSATPVPPGGQQGVAPAGGARVLPDALIGADPTQLVAAERLRTTAGASAVDKLLGLDEPPPLLGAFPPPPGNIEALRHLTPEMRHAGIRLLLARQRARMRQLSQLLRREQEHQGERDEDDPADGDELDQQSGGVPATRAVGIQSSRQQLSDALKMLELLEDLHSMQDYILSQIFTFSKG